MVNEKVTEELNGLAKRLEIAEEDMTEKYNDIANANNLDVETEREAMVALTLTRNWARGMLRRVTPSTGKLVKNGFGFFVAIEDARDVQQWNRNQVLSDYNSNPNSVFNEERVAEVELVEAGYQKSQIKNGEVETKIIPNLPNSAMEVDENKWIVPIDNRKTWQSGDPNDGYSLPLPKELYRRRAHFIAKHSEADDFSSYVVNMKDDLAKSFNVETFRWVNLVGIYKDAENVMYGVGKNNQTLNSILYNDAIDNEHDRYVDTEGLNMETLLANHLSDYLTELTDLENYHDSIKHEPVPSRLVVTDGIVSSMNLVPNEKTGNRTIYIEPLDANYGFEEGDIPEPTPCWVPSHVNLNFGVGSDVIVVGRSNQTQKKDENGMFIPDEFNSVSINLFGVYTRVSVGAVDTVNAASEEDIQYW
jgi:hypothetical protein